MDIVHAVLDVIHAEYSVDEGNKFEQMAIQAGMEGCNETEQIQWVAMFFSVRLARHHCPVPVIDVDDAPVSIREHLRSTLAHPPRRPLDGPLVIRLWFKDSILPKIKKYKLSL